MKVELKEDDRVRAQRAEWSKQAVKPVARVVLCVGLPIVIVWSAGLYWIAPDQIQQFILATPAVLLIGLLLPWICNLGPVVRNRWMVEKKKIRFRGQRYGGLRLGRVEGWFVREIEELPEYYSLNVRSWISGATIILNENDYPLSEIEKLLPADKKTEVPACLLPK